MRRPASSTTRITSAFGYRCFDRILLNGLIQRFQQPERVIGFFNSYRQLYPVSRDVLHGAAEQFQTWVKEQANRWDTPIIEAPKGRRDEFVEPYFKGGAPDQIVVEKDKPLASADRRALGRAIQLLYQRPTLGPDVRAHVPLSAVLRPGLS